MPSQRQHLVDQPFSDTSCETKELWSVRYRANTTGVVYQREPNHTQSMPRIRKPTYQEDAAEEDHVELATLTALAEPVCCAISETKQPVSIRIVKMKLNTFCSLAPNTRFRTEVGKLVLDANRLLGEAYAFANLHVCRLLATGAAVPSIDRNLYYRCLLAVSINNAKPKTLGDDVMLSVEMFNKLRTDIAVYKVDMRNHHQLIADLSITMSTMATNHLHVNLPHRLKSYLRWKHADMKGFWKTISDAVLLTPKKPLASMFPSHATNARCASAMVVATRLRLLLPLTGPTLFASKAHLTLPFYKEVLADSEAEVARLHASDVDGKCRRRRPRTFSLLPTKRSFTINYIPLSNMTMMKLLQLAKVEDHVGDGRNLDHRSIWSKHFNLKAVETKTSKFDLRILTDGYGVSVQLEGLSSATCNSSQPFIGPIAKHSRVVGVDPGFTDVVTLTDNTGTTKSYSSARYYEDACFNHSAHRTKRWNKESEENVAHIPSGDTADLVRLSSHIKSYIAELPSLLKHRWVRGYRQMRFLRFVQRQKAVHDICDLIAPKGLQTLVGFGDWSGGHNSPISRRTCGPLAAIKFELSTRPGVTFRTVNEYLTSQTCHGCQNRLCNMKAMSTRIKRSEDGGVTKTMVKSRVHKVLHCRNSDERASARCGTTWNRDVNASKNILTLVKLEMEGLSRPPAFCRPAAPPVVKKQSTIRGSREKAQAEPAKTVIRVASLPASGQRDTAQELKRKAVLSATNWLAVRCPNLI